MSDAASRTCPDCAVMPGEQHETGCDVARCWWTGRQRLTCNSKHQDMGLGHGVDVGVSPCGLDVWTGEWPGDAECREFGWWVQDRCAEGLGWVPCAADAPGATEDLNRLARDARWSPELKRWVLR